MANERWPVVGIGASAGGIEAFRGFFENMPPDSGSGPLHDGMPASAIATGAVDIIAAVEAMPGHIVAIQDSRGRTEGLAELSPEQLTAARLAICAALSRHLGHDFSGYRDETFLRRVQRRMQVLGLASLDVSVERLEHDRHEVVLLFRGLKQDMAADVNVEFPASGVRATLSAPLRVGPARPALDTFVA